MKKNKKYKTKLVQGGMRNYNSPVPNLFPPPESMRPTLVGSNYMITAGHPIIAKIASNILESGGNAIDAGVAAGLASNVIQADMCNLGGVAPIMIRKSNSKKVWSISGVGHWSNSISLRDYKNKYGNDIPEGAPSCVIPAALDSWTTALSKFGTMSFSQVASDAIHYAEEGFPLDLRSAKALELMGNTFKKWNSSKKIYWPEGRAPKTGEFIKQRDLANLLKYICSKEKGINRIDDIENVRKGFYTGKIAKKIVSWVKEGGGWMTLDDLSKFRNQVYLAPSYNYKGWQVFTSDTYSQGPVLLQALSILNGFNLKDLKHNSSKYIHLLTETLKIAFSEREKYYGDNNPNKNILDELLNVNYIKKLRSLINFNCAQKDLPTLNINENYFRKKDTTYFSIIDKKGNAFSCSPSDTIDGNPIVEGLGIIISPRGIQSRLENSHPASIGPGFRPRLTPAPSIAIFNKSKSFNNSKIMTLGASGGDVIIQGMIQTFLNYVEFDMTLQQSAEAPRFTTLSFPDSFYPNVHQKGRLSIEKRIDSEVIKDLSKMGHDVHLWPEYEFDSSGVAISSDLASPKGEKRILGAGVDIRRTQYSWGY